MRFEMRENAGRLPLLAGAYQGLGKMFHAIEDPFEECFFIFFSFFFVGWGDSLFIEEEFLGLSKIGLLGIR